MASATDFTLPLSPSPLSSFTGKIDENVFKQKLSY
jgi:hypothetical protein